MILLIMSHKTDYKVRPTQLLTNTTVFLYIGDIDYNGRNWIQAIYILAKARLSERMITAGYGRQTLFHEIHILKNQTMDLSHFCWHEFWIHWNCLEE